MSATTVGPPTETMATRRAISARVGTITATCRQTQDLSIGGEFKLMPMRIVISSGDTSVVISRQQWSAISAAVEAALEAYDKEFK